MADPELKEKVEELIAANPVLLFMKGTPEMPRCGFSMRVVQVLDQMDVEYGAIDVLPALQPLREVTAEISDWQTFPQLYVNGELIGGADIVEEMFESGELAEALGVEQPEVARGRLREDPRRSPRRCRSNNPATAFAIAPYEEVSPYTHPLSSRHSLSGIELIFLAAGLATREKPTVVRAGKLILKLNGRVQLARLPKSKLAPISLDAHGQVTSRVTARQPLGRYDRHDRL